jgi:predicted nucleic acid-binding protein
MIFIDSNIPMYLVGAAHTHKKRAEELLEIYISKDSRLVTDAEVLQEILHRYSAIKRLDAIQPAFDSLLKIVDEVFEIQVVDVERAKSFVLATQRLSARDALHIAVMERQGIVEIMSFDADLDAITSIKRLY